MKLSGKFAAVTGASIGIGRAIAVQFAKDGADVALLGSNKQALNETKEIIKKSSGKAQIYEVDLSKTNSIKAAIEQIKSNTDVVNILANVAGIWHGENKAYSDTDYSDFSQQVIIDTMNVGTIAPMLLTNGLLSIMPKHGKILNISGTFESGAKGWLPYYVSKKAIEDLTVGLAEELKEKDIQVNCISPSDVATEPYKKFFPEYVKDAIEPEEIAKYAVVLCTNESDSVTGKIFVVKKGEEPREDFHY